MEFDRDTERCVYCDGHWKHYCPCPYRNCADGCTGSPHIAEPTDPWDDVEDDPPLKSTPKPRALQHAREAVKHAVKKYGG